MQVPLVRCFRLMQLADEVDEAELQQPDFEQLLHKRLQQAVLLRQRLGLPSEQTNVYRLCNRWGWLCSKPPWTHGCSACEVARCRQENFFGAIHALQHMMHLCSNVGCISMPTTSLSTQ